MEFIGVKHPKLLNLFPESAVPVGSNELDLRLSLPVESAANLVENKKKKKDPSVSFYQFDDVRSYDKFEAGQIWVFYGDEDYDVPRHYGKIKEVIKIGSRIELKVIYLTFFWLSNKVDRWDDNDMIISFGKFKAKGKHCTYHNTIFVSHQVHANIVGRNNDYEFYPRLGEIWAMYRGWTSKLKPSDLKNCEYDIVEVTKDGYSWTHVLFLEKVSGYSSVFKRKLTKRLYFSIDRSEVLRFSHRIPAFKLTEEHGSNLKGFWELDPDAIPVRYLR